jgi:hypothetical protein
MEAAQLYESFPRHLRPELRVRILADPESPFREGPDETWTGRGFAIALSDSNTPITNCTLPQLFECMGLNNDQKRELAATFLRWMRVLRGSAPRGSAPFEPQGVEPPQTPP